MTAKLVAFLVVALAGSPYAAAEPRWEASLASTTGTPPVLSQGLALGAGAEMRRVLRSGPAFVFGRLGWMEASQANPSWIIDHHQFTAVTGAGVAATYGVGRVWIEAGAGASGLYEILSRHQRQRIDAAGVPGGAHTTFTVGAHALGEVGVAVRFWGGAGAFLAAGPTLTRTMVDGSALWRAGAAARLGVSYGF